MEWQSSPYLIPLGFTALVGLAMAFLGWRNRATTGAVSFSILMLLTAWWSFFYLVEIARDLGAATPGRSAQPRISGAVTQEMLDAAEQRYVDAVQEAWEGHGFPWNDSDVLGRLEELDSLVSALETIMQDADGEMGTRVATDFNDDGYVDINDLWDAHQR